MEYVAAAETLGTLRFRGNVQSGHAVWLASCSCSLAVLLDKRKG